MMTTRCSVSRDVFSRRCEQMPTKKTLRLPMATPSLSLVFGIRRDVAGQHRNGLPGDRPPRCERLDLRASYGVVGARARGQLAMHGAEELVGIVVGDVIERADDVARSRGEKSAAEAEGERL